MDAHALRMKGLFPNQPAVKRLSNQILLVLGHRDSRGKNVYEPEDVIKLKKRKEIVLKKLKTTK